MLLKKGLMIHLKSQLNTNKPTKLGHENKIPGVTTSEKQVWDLTHLRCRCDSFYKDLVHSMVVFSSSSAIDDDRLFSMKDFAFSMCMFALS